MHASGTALGLNPAADPVFRNYAPQCSTRRFHGTGRSIGTSMALPSMPFREHLCTRSWHRLAVDPVFRNHAHAAPQGFSMVLAGPSRHLWLCLLYALYALYCLLFSSSEDAISRASLRTLLAPSGVESCWGSGVSQPCPTIFHSAFPWYWPVHLCLVCLVRLVLPSV